ncbi:MAG: hypothetical protein HZB51_25650 [Chloroflexi bacterium]|nr:hypothetical protein [Chloroflexota bacterium]
MKSIFKREEGQSIIIVAAGLVALIALMAMVVDAGNAYVQRRQTQNAIDAASQAGTIALAKALRDSSVHYGDIDSAVRAYAGANGLDKTKIKVYFVGQDAAGNKVIIPNPVASYGNTSVNKTINYNGTVYTLVGVQAEGTKNFPTFFAGLIGFKDMDVAANGASYARCGACSGNGLFPIVVAAGLFDNLPAPPPTEQSNKSYYYTIWENKKNMAGVSAGNFGYIQWPGNQPSATTLAYNMDNAENYVSGIWQVGDSVSGDPGISAGTAVMDALARRVSGPLSSFVTLPVYDTFSDSGNNRTYRIKGFARFRLTCYHFSNSAGGSGGSCQGSYGPGDKFIQAQLQAWIDPQANGGCTDFGVCTVKTNTPVTQTARSLIGSVKINQLTRTNTTATSVHVPVDAILVLDLSPSMDWDFDGKSTSDVSKKKITAARAALKIFNTNFYNMKKTNPTYTDQLGLVSFPLQTTGSQYTSDCKQKLNLYQTGKLEYDLNGSLASITNISNTVATKGLPAGNTPTAGAIKVARQYLLGANHKAGHLPVMIIATDGRANVRGDSMRFNGYNIDFDSCNNLALSDATNEAMIAKSDNNHDGQPDTIVFVIASGSEYVNNPTVSSFFKAMATQDTDPSLPHFIPAGNKTDLENAFKSISTRIEHIGSESCKIIQSEAFANGFNLTATNQNSGRTYQVTTTSTGEFVIPNIDPGTYVFSTGGKVIDGLNYNVFTLGIGGADGSYPITVGDNSGQYRTDLFLRAGTQVSCQ